MKSNWLQEEKQLIDRMLLQEDHLQKTVAEESKELKSAILNLKHTQDAQEILQRLAQAVQEKAHKKISEVVTACLAAVFDNPYEFHIEFERKRGKTEAKLRFRRNGLDVDPITSSGGGMIDVAAFALRVAALVLHRPRLSRVVVLDEPFRFVSAQYRENVRSMLEGLAKDMGIQIIMVTHIEELSTGKIIEI